MKDQIYTKNKKLFPGFTLTEILIVLALIGVFSSIIVANFSSIRNRSSDEKLVAELSQVSLALEEYKKLCGTYPVSISGGLEKASFVSGYSSNICQTENPKNNNRVEDIQFLNLIPGSALSFDIYNKDILRYEAIRYGNSHIENSICSGYIVGVKLSGSDSVAVHRLETGTITKRRADEIRGNRIEKMQCNRPERLDTTKVMESGMYYIESANGY
jgi:prepilin-type N-terminal cleavage/methylation domain-containing protein